MAQWAQKLATATSLRLRCRTSRGRKFESLVVKNQKRCAGQQKVAKHKVKSIKPNSAFVLVYSFGDEMYRWARVSSLLKPFKAHVDDVYTYKGKKGSISNHLRTADVAPFNGREALHEAEEELRRQQREREQASMLRKNVPVLMRI